VYFVVLTPIGIVMRLTGRRTLVHALQGNGYWFDRRSSRPEASSMERQF
jgi:hypothetical protein